MEDIRNEVLQAEIAFCAMASVSGICAAFLAFAAEDGVIVRDQVIYKGREEIQRYFDENNHDNVKLEWYPDYIDVSTSGDLAYTFGNYTVIPLDPESREAKHQGTFHTVWKKQNDGSWKFVFD